MSFLQPIHQHTLLNQKFLQQQVIQDMPWDGELDTTEVYAVFSSFISDNIVLHISIQC